MNIGIKDFLDSNMAIYYGETIFLATVIEMFTTSCHKIALLGSVYRKFHYN